MTVCAAATSSAVRAGEARPSRNAVSRTSARMIGGSLFARSSYAAILRRLYRETPAIWWARQRPNLSILGAKHAIDASAFESSGQFAERLAHISDRGGFGAVIAHHPHGFLDQGEIAQRR